MRAACRRPLLAVAGSSLDDAVGGASVPTENAATPTVLSIHHGPVAAYRHRNPDLGRLARRRDPSSSLPLRRVGLVSPTRVAPVRPAGCGPDLCGLEEFKSTRSA